MFKIDIDIDSLKKLDKHIEFVNKMLKMKTDKEFQDYIKKKCLDEVKSYARLRLTQNTTTNEDLKDEYINGIFIRDTSNGFDIVSNLTIDKPTTPHSDGYTFSVSMAFEYGTGIIGMGSADAPSGYRYNVNENKVVINDELVDGWWIPANKAGNSITFGESKSGSAVVTQGYEGMEIFRFAGANITQKMPQWLNDYFKEVA